MKKFNPIWIVLIVICSLVIIGGLLYLLYRLYINHIYKRKRFWKDITSISKLSLEEHNDESSNILMPRQSILPFIHQLKRQNKQRKMITQLQFDEPPIFEHNFIKEWDDMDTKSLFLLQFKSNQTSYYTIRESISSEKSIQVRQSLMKHYSITSEDELFTPPTSVEQLSLSLSDSDGITLFDKNNSSNYMKIFQKINISNNVSNV